jgi:hypothetical protein
MHSPEHAEYHYSKFLGQLSSLQKTIADQNDRAEEDHQDFTPYLAIIVQFKARNGSEIA